MELTEYKVFTSRGGFIAEDLSTGIQAFGASVEQAKERLVFALKVTNAQRAE